MIHNGQANLVAASTTGEYAVSEDGKTITVFDRRTTDITISKKEFVEGDANGKDIEGDGQATFIFSVNDADETLIGKTIAGVKIDENTEGLTNGGKSYTFTGNNTEVKRPEERTSELQAH